MLFILFIFFDTQHQYIRHGRRCGRWFIMFPCFSKSSFLRDHFVPFGRIVFFDHFDFIYARPLLGLIRRPFRGRNLFYTCQARCLGRKDGLKPFLFLRHMDFGWCCLHHFKSIGDHRAELETFDWFVAGPPKKYTCASRQVGFHTVVYCAAIALLARGEALGEWNVLDFSESKWAIAVLVLLTAAIVGDDIPHALITTTRRKEKCTAWGKEQINK